MLLRNVQSEIETFLERYWIINRMIESLTLIAALIYFSLVLITQHWTIKTREARGLRIFLVPVMFWVLASSSFVHNRIVGLLWIFLLFASAFDVSLDRALRDIG